MIVTPIRTRPLIPPKDDLLAVLDQAMPADLKEESIVVITSKVVAIWQGRCEPVPAGDAKEQLRFKDALAAREADYYLPRGEGPDAHRMHTITDGVLIGAAGIDQSNGNGYYILWPEDPMTAAAELRAHIGAVYSVQRLGVIIADSHSSPLRNGAIGITLGYAGCRAQYDYRGTMDLFGRSFQAERLNVVDSLASAANLVMGEGAECTPFAVIEDAPHVEFSDTEATDPWLQLSVPLSDDIFNRFLVDQPWKKGDTHDSHDT